MKIRKLRGEPRQRHCNRACKPRWQGRPAGRCGEAGHRPAARWGQVSVAASPGDGAPNVRRRACLHMLRGYDDLVGGGQACQRSLPLSACKMHSAPAAAAPQTREQWHWPASTERSAQRAQHARVAACSCTLTSLSLAKRGSNAAGAGTPPDRSSCRPDRQGGSSLVRQT